jgi:hypothetical protein
MRRSWMASGRLEINKLRERMFLRQKLEWKLKEGSSRHTTHEKRETTNGNS